MNKQLEQSVQSYNSLQDIEVQNICSILAQTIQKLLPNTTSKVWHGHPVWFISGNPVVGYSNQKLGVRLLFWSGQSFKSKGLTASGSFKAAERIYKSQKEIDTAQLTEWLKESIIVQWDYKNIVKRRGELVRLDSNVE